MKNIDPHILKLLEDIYVSVNRIMDRLQNETRERFLSTQGIDAQDIVARRLSIISEAATAILRKHPDFAQQNLTIPLRQAKGIRNILVHDYNGINWEIVWNTVKEGIPQLIDSIKPFLSEE